MEPKFKTSFIPKKSFEQPAPIQPRGGGGKGGSLGILGIAGIAIFVMAAASAGGVYFYRWSLESSIADKAVQLEQAREAFQPALIRLLERLDIRLKTADQLLNNHISFSALFPLLETTTYADVQFKGMSVAQDSNNQIAMTMQGEARDFDVVALQSDVFGQNRHILEPVFSELDVVDQNRVSFNVRSRIDRQHLLYVNRVSAGDYEATEDIPLPAPAEVPETQPAGEGQANEGDAEANESEE